VRRGLVHVDHGYHVYQVGTQDDGVKVEAPRTAMWTRAQNPIFVEQRHIAVHTLQKHWGSDNGARRVGTRHPPYSVQ